MSGKPEEGARGSYHRKMKVKVSSTSKNETKGGFNNKKEIK